MMRVEIRLGIAQDADQLLGLDPIAKSDKDRASLLRNALDSGTCYVAESNFRVIGYGILSYNFYGHGMINLLIVSEECRRCGVGTELLNHMAEQCKTPKLFTSTNQSNLPMQAFLLKCGFDSSGVIENLDEGDLELVFFKSPG